MGLSYCVMLQCVSGGGLLPITAEHPQGYTNHTKLLCNFSQREKCYLLCEETINPPKMILHAPEFHPKEKKEALKEQRTPISLYLCEDAM